MSLAHTIAKALGGAIRSGSAWCCQCPVHKGSKSNLAIRDTSNGTIQVYCHAGCDYRSIIDNLKEQGLLSKELARLKPAPESNEEEEKDRSKKIERASKIWNEAFPTTTIIENYFQNRNINYEIPETLRFHQSLYHPETKTRCIAMIGLVEHTIDGPTGVHCTYLAPYGRTKADLTPNKRFIGAIKGAAVQLAPIADTIAVCEGIESAMSYMEATSTPTWAALSANGLKHLVLPDNVGHVIIAADPDPVGMIAARKAAKRWLAEGRKVSIARPPQNKDFNDLARTK